MERVRFTRLNFNKEKVKGLTLNQFKKKFRKPYGEAGVDLTSEYYALFPERKPKPKAEEESEG